MPKGKRLNIKTPEDFWKYVKKGNLNDCWEWQKGKTTAGYGQFFFPAYQHQYAHRFAFEITFGGPIPAGIHICHHCDNPVCCNPNHLFAGTRSDNMQDMIAKGRANRSGFLTGEDHPCHKLTEVEVIEIRRLYAGGGYSYRDLTTMFNVSVGTVSNIINFKVWRHIKAKAA